MKKNFENFTHFGDSKSRHFILHNSVVELVSFKYSDLCTELSRVLSDQTQTLEEHMNSVRNALNEIKVLIPKKLKEEVKDAAKNRGKNTYENKIFHLLYVA